MSTHEKHTEDVIVEYLKHGITRDKLKGGTGHRTTSEVAEFLGMPNRKARNILHKMESDGLIDCFVDADRPGNTLNWTLPGKETSC